MNDEQMIKWLRGQVEWCNSQSAYGPAENCRQIADRLEQLTRHLERSPISAARLREIRMVNKVVYQDGNGTFSDPVFEDRHLLLAAYDHERRLREHTECVMADLAGDNESLIRIGVARALAVIEEAREGRRPTDYPNAHYLIDNLCALIRARCGPAELPPHEQSLALLRRYEATLAKLLAYSELDDEQARDAGILAPGEVGYVTGVVRKAMENGE